MEALGACAKFTSGFLHPVTGFTVTWGKLDLMGLGCKGGEVRGVSLNWVGFITGSLLRAISACPRSLARVQAPVELVMPCRN